MSGHVVKRRDYRGAGRCLAAMLALTVIMSVSGAYDTDDYSMPHRLALFIVINGLLFGQAWVLDDAFRRVLHGGPAKTVIAGLVTITLTLVLMTVEVSALKYTPLLPKEHDPIFEFALFLTPVVIVVAGLVILLKSPAVSQLVELEPLEVGYEKILELSAHPVIAGLLPPPAPEALTGWPSTPILRVISQDHYLEVTTQEGAVLIRGRMKDALVRLDNERGVCPHRSWWVAQSEITSVHKRGR